VSNTDKNGWLGFLCHYFSPAGEASPRVPTCCYHLTEETFCFHVAFPTLFYPLL